MTAERSYQFTSAAPPYGASYGETFIEQGGHTYDNPYKFNGKELDPETGLYYYGARYYDPKISLWLSVDPLAGVNPDKTPYNYTSNNPVVRIDPTGMVDNPIYGKNGEFIGCTKEGFTGEFLIYLGDDKNIDFSKMSKDQALELDDVYTYDQVRNKLDKDAKSKIWTNIVKHFEGLRVYDEVFSLDNLKDNEIKFGGTGSWTTYFNLSNNFGKIFGSDKYNYETTVENIASSIIVHEWYSHLMKKNRDKLKSHRLAYKNVINYKFFWNKTTDKYKAFYMRMLRYYTEKETGRKQVDPLYRRLYLKYYKVK